MALTGQAQKTLRAIVDAIPAMIGYWDAQLCNQFANKAYSQYFTCGQKELTGLHIREVLGEKIYEANLPAVRWLTTSSANCVNCK